MVESAEEFRDLPLKIQISYYYPDYRAVLGKTTVSFKRRAVLGKTM